MKFRAILLVAILLCAPIKSFAGGSSDGCCWLIQLNSHKEFIEFINNNPYKIERVDYKWFITPIYYVWYNKGDN